MKEDKDLVLCCEGGCSGHHLVIRQPRYEDPKMDDRMVYITVHLDKLTFWKRVRWFITGKNKKWGDFVETLTTKEKLQDIVNQLE